VAKENGIVLLISGLKPNEPT